ncbi:MAG TPA: HAMP domain-containing sensor histidine kinase [Pyrinomonadaceae bacterium]|jgi:two-component system sensor histidine kinase CpxA
MLGVKFSLFWRIIIWFFLNLLVLGVILFVFFSYNFRFRPNSGFAGFFTSGIEGVTREISNELNNKTRAERDEALKKYSDRYKGVEFFLFDNRGSQLGGREIQLPPAISEQIIREEPFPPPNPNANAAEKSQMPFPPRGGGAPPMMPVSTYIKTENPTLYWFGARTITFEKDGDLPERTRLLAVSDSFYGYGLYFNPTPWLILTAIIVLVSFLFWFPFVRNITRATEKLTRATEEIADENFNVRIDENRSDELGVLGRAINHLAKRLDGFVGGQKRFLGDISHELNSPLARMQFALSILEDRGDEKNLAYVEDVKEEVELMSRLVAELLTYSKAGMKTPDVALEKVVLRPLIERVVERETANETAEIKISVSEKLEVLAQPELLARAIGNVVRNAVRYAAGAGAINISATNGNSLVEIKIADSGAGVPDESLDKLFDPFFRVEMHRSRETGGTGLGLAIVKTCIEACQGKVFAENLAPKGFEVTILLKN